MLDRVTLHEEMVAILAAAGAEGMEAAEMARLVNARGRYQKGDGSAMGASQIRLRARKYSHLFDLNGSRVSLRSSAPRPRSVRSRSPAASQPPWAAESAASRADLLSQAIAALSEPGLTFEEAGTVAPRRPGLYAISATSDGLKELDLEGADVIYVGKSESSLEGRDLRQHFADGQTGRSTLRRSLAALLTEDLGLTPQPRNPLKPADFDRYALDDASDRGLSQWMRIHLRLAFWAAPPGTVLRPVEVAVIQRLAPPLNLTDCVTPYTATIKARRRSMADRARASAFGR